MIHSNAFAAFRQAEPDLCEIAERNRAKRRPNLLLTIHGRTSPVYRRVRSRVGMEYCEGMQ